MEEDEKLFLLFINYIGKDLDDKNLYEFLFGTEKQKEVFWGEDFEQKPAGICNDLTPMEDSFEDVRKIRVKFKLDLAKDSCCYSMSDCIDGVIALAWENIDNYDEYPTDGRFIVQFGESFEVVEDKLANKGTFII